MNCELCGKEGNLVIALVEGIQMKVCPNCSKYGKILDEVKPIAKKEKKKINEEEYVEGIVEDYAKLIKNKREELGLKQEELAKKINERESVIHKIENGSLEPSVKLAKKLERFLKIKLIKEYSVKYKKIGNESKLLTIGDLIGNKK